MAFSYGERSKSRLVTADPRLQELFGRAIKHVDIYIICGHRGREDQTVAVANGASKTPWPRSKHNPPVSLAIDSCLWYPKPPNIHWETDADFWRLAGFLQGIGYEMGVETRVGVDFDMDWTTKDKFIDGPHIELVDDKAWQAWLASPEAQL